jgi:radical SAM protein
MKLIRQPAYNTDDRPFLVIWETTQACDLSCLHCRALAHPERDADELTFEQGCQLIDQIAGFGAPPPMFILTGGDPFKRPDIFDLVHYAATRGLTAAVSPSSTPLLTRENLQRLQAAGTRAISLSLDGSTPAIHDEFRRVPGSYTWVINGWKAARELGLKVQINTTVTRYNLMDLPQILARVLELGAMTWSVFFLVPTGRGRPEDEISPQDYEAVLNFLYDASHYTGLKTTEGHHYKRVVLQRTVLDQMGLDAQEVLGLNDTYRALKSGLGAVTAGAQAPKPAERMRRTPMHVNSGQGFVFISLRGDVFPSGYLPLSAGNILEKPLGSIYRESDLFRSLRQPDGLKGRCGQCEFRLICGGSRSRAYAMTGDALAEEPFCSYQPGSFPYIAEVEALLNSASPSANTHPGSA